MFDSIKKIVAHHYGIHVLSIERKSDAVYILNHANGRFVLKKIKQLNEATFGLKLPYFVPIIPTLYQQEFFIYQKDYYFLMPFISLQENGFSHLSTALNQLSQIHQNTFYTSQVDQRYYSYEIEDLKERLLNSYQFYDHLMDALLEKIPYHPAYFQLIYLYPQILWFKDLALNLLKTYEQDVKDKKTCRMCLSFNRICFENFSPIEQCWIGKEHTSFELVGKDVLGLFRLPIEVENIEQFYLPHITLYEEEKRWILLQLLCLETWDFFQDAYMSVEQLHRLENYFVKLNKIINSLQIEEIVLYNK